jgi:hypothetical protein
MTLVCIGIISDALRFLLAGVYGSAACMGLFTLGDPGAGVQDNLPSPHIRGVHDSGKGH